MIRLSSDKVLRILLQIGLPQIEAKVYLVLAIKGPKKTEDLANELQMSSLKLHVILKRLQERGFVSAAPANFVAIPFEILLDTLARNRLQEAQEITEKKNTILSQWRSIVTRNSKS
jgi:sugar-specific transcriptional regulator TrmB